MSNYSVSRGSPRRILGSNKEFEAKLPTTVDRGLFNERCIDVRTERTIGDYFREIYYLYKDDEKGSKELGKKYLLKKLVKLFAADNISEKDKLDLEKFIEESEVFKKKATHIQDITKIDLMKIRSQVGAKFIIKEYEKDLKSSSESLVEDLDKKISLYNDLYNFYRDQGDIQQAVVTLNDLVSVYKQQENIMNIVNIIKCYEQILDLREIDNNTRKETLNSMAFIYEEQGNTRKAIEYNEQILSLKGLSLNDKRTALHNLIRIYRKENNIDKEIECCERILSLEKLSLSDKRSILDHLIRIYRKENNIDKEIECYERISSLEGLSLSDKRSVLDNLANIYYKQNNIDKAIECYEQILSFEGLSLSDQYMILEGLVDLYHDQNNIDNEIECYERMLSLDGLPMHYKSKALNALAEVYCNQNNIDKAIKYYEQILDLEGISNHMRANTLKSMTGLYLQKEDPVKAIECYEQISNFGEWLSLSDKQILEKLVRIYLKKNNIDKAIECYERILNCEGLSSNDKRSILDNLAGMYHNQNNKDKEIECYERILSLEGLSMFDQYMILDVLADLYHNQNNIDKEIEYYEGMLSLDGLPVLYKGKALNALAELYYLQNNIDKAIKCYEQILGLEGISQQMRVNTLKSIADLYVQQGDLVKAIEYCEQILSLEGTDDNQRKETLRLMIYIYEQQGNTAKLIQLYMQHYLIPAIEKDHQDDVDFSQKVLSLFKAKSDAEILNILEILFKNSSLWQGENKFFMDEWISVINSEDPLSQFKHCIYRRYQQFITVSNDINKDLLMDDPTMSAWNVLVQPKGVVDNENWDLWKTLAHDISDSINAGDENKKLYLVKFFDQCMGAADANNETGKQNIRKRVVACINYLNELKIRREASNNETEKELLAKQIKGGLDIIEVGGAACADRAIVFLTNLEVYIKLLENPKYLPNLMVLMYKLEVIKDYLTNPAMAENIETYLYYCLNLNLILGLGLPEGGEMLYEGVAVKMPIEEALQKLSPGFNAEGLLEFTAINETFKSIYEKEMDVNAAVMEAGYAFLEADDGHTDAVNAKKPQEEIDQLYRIAEEAKLTWETAKHNFYKEKARALFHEAGFLM